MSKEGGEELKQPEPQSTKDNGNAQLPTNIRLEEEWTTVTYPNTYLLSKDFQILNIQKWSFIESYFRTHFLFTVSATTKWLERRKFDGFSGGGRKK